MRLLIEHALTFLPSQVSQRLDDSLQLQVLIVLQRSQEKNWTLDKNIKDLRWLL